MKFTVFQLLLLLAIPMLAQDYFNKRIEFSHPWVFDGAGNSLEIGDGYIINGVTGHSLNSTWHQLAITKLDFFGEVIWKKSWGDTISRWYFADRNSLIKHYGFFYSTGSKQSYHDTISYGIIHLTKYNNTFDTLWTKYYGDNLYPYDSTYIARSFMGIENGFAVVGTMEINYGETHEPYLLLMDSLGIVENEYNYPDSGYYFHGNSVIQTIDGGYAIGAYKHIIGHYGAAIGDPIVIKTDSLGNKVWELNLGGQYQDGTAILCQSGDGNIIAASRYDTDSIYHNIYLSRIQLTKIDNEGNILWNNLYCEKKRSTEVSNIRADSSGGYIISGTIGENNWPIEPSFMGFMLRVDSEGDSLWYRKYAVLYDESSLNYLYDVIPTSDGGFLGAGGCLPVGSDTGTQDAWVIKVDSMGCTSPWDCWVGEEELVWDTTNTGILLKIYPNPASSWFEVEITENERDVIIEVFDIYGRKVEEIEIPNGQTNTRVNVIGWKSGIYVVRIKDNNGIVQSRKVLIK